MSTGACMHDGQWGRQGCGVEYGVGVTLLLGRMIYGQLGTVFGRLQWLQAPPRASPSLTGLILPATLRVSGVMGTDTLSVEVQLIAPWWCWWARVSGDCGAWVGYALDGVRHSLEG